ncbi:hypothetical protein JCGZ_18200 [Jatropha curcas]|uniref:Large ribosomal subunit protein bL12 C-terminal domain-containing protein n=1 Tax=Jatropha curcas TaxID=180498 RepID=A0A067K210_JATCU|nr:hypothetical protein JCGZ_18200 [Jatropha curcas]
MKSNGALSRGFSQPAEKNEEERKPPSEHVSGLVDEIAGLTLTEVADLTYVLMKKKGMTELPVLWIMNGGGGAGFAGMPMKASAAASKEEKKAEKTVFELKLESYEAASKIKIIKEVRSFTNLGLKEAKDLVEKTPSLLKAGVSKEEAEKIIEKMKAVGAKVVME